MATTVKGSAERGSRTDENSSPQRDAFSAIELLEEGHREVEGFFEEYQELENEAEKEALALKICLTLQIHAQIEEELFYPEAQKAIARASRLCGSAGHISAASR